MVRSMTSGNPIGLILAFTVPLLIGNVFQQFYNIADIIIVGRTIGVNALAAVGASPCLYVRFWRDHRSVGRFFGHCRPALRRQRHGRPAPFCGDIDMLAFAITLMVTAGVSLAMPLILRVMNISGVLYDDAYHYMIIIVLGLMAMMAYNLLSSICRALGTVGRPFISSSSRLS